MGPSCNECFILWGITLETTSVYTRQRSTFWLRVNENADGGYNFFVSEAVLPVFKHHFSEVEDASPTGWKTGKGHTQYIWVPENRSAGIDVNEIKEWAEFAGNQCVWLGLSKHLQGHFTDSELDYCVAGDFNFTIDTDGNIGHRSALGEAEFKLKYHLGDISEADKKRYIECMVRALQDIVEILPVRLGSKWFGPPPIVSPIPAQSDSSQLAWAFAKHIAEKNDLPFLAPTLNLTKPKMKELSIDQKTATWNSIYTQPNAIAIDPESVPGKTVIVIDDLYQSGITMWAYAKFLKRLGARYVYGVVCVKSMTDTDNP